MTIDVGLRFASNEAAYRRARTVAPWLAVAAVFVAAVLLRQVMPFNVDVSWGFIVSERMLDGQRLYVDILETNPPMAVSVYVLGVALARAFALAFFVQGKGWGYQAYPMVALGLLAVGCAILAIDHE